MTTSGIVGGPVDERATRVTVRRIVQYFLDLFVLGAVLAGVGWLLGRIVPAAGFEVGRSGSLGFRMVGPGGPGPSTVGFVALVVLGFVAFVLIPFWTGRTLLMMALGLKIVRRDGEPASFGQHLGRALLLVVDTIAGGLVGLIVMLCSRHRQRVGDHAAGTVVIRG
ncbi:RDD family protein [Actinomycetospora soli]|uniref:RDD family protein n=1 Tax=Actinomycetospora soli TaxID=2893887 RepID=UPI001E62F840|nr:RDD family protein [Actinomycetospora soli]MCD2186037.1 RDD family protein [Actinomycetospora soli]